MLSFFQKIPFRTMSTPLVVEILQILLLSFYSAYLIFSIIKTPTYSVLILALIGTAVIIVTNPVHSVFLLVSVFLGAAVALFKLQLEFMPLIFIIVYVGAIAVLFLFVVMMLDIKVTSKSNDFEKYLPIGGLIGDLFIINVYYILIEKDIFKYTPINLGYDIKHTNWLDFVDKVSNIETLGQLMYTYYFIYFLIAGIILLVAMVAAIVLTLQFNKNVKNQLLFKQLSRNAKSAVFLVQN